MKNKILSGDTITLPAPAGGAVSGVAFLIGTIIGVPVASAAATVPVAVQVEGVFELPKTSAQAWTGGAAVYWDDTNKVVTTTASGNTLCGIAFAAAANPSPTGWVKLKGR